MLTQALLEGRRMLERPWRLFRRIKATLVPVKDYALEGLRFATTNVCNAACVFCSYPSAELSGKKMPILTFQKAVALMGGRMDTLDLSPAIGEPLVDTGLVDKISWAKSCGYKTQFSTNGILLESELCQKLIGLAPDHRGGPGLHEILVSIPSFNPDKYKEQFGVDKGNKAIVGLYRLLSENRSQGQPVRIGIRVRQRGSPSSELNSGHFAMFKPFITGNVTLEFTSQWETWNNVVDFSKWSRWMLSRRKTSPLIDRPCRNLRGGLVNPDGTVRLCGCRVVKTDHDDLLIGNVDNSWKELEAAATKIRNGFYGKVYPTTCQECSFYNPE